MFKGVFPQGKAVAVKIMESSKEAWKDFIHEVDIMTTLKHTKIAPLLGVCVEDDALISVYDLMPLGNLEENLHGECFTSSNFKLHAKLSLHHLRLSCFLKQVALRENLCC